jgi:GNAT superfamily N-acetyltransferase
MDRPPGGNILSVRLMDDTYIMGENERTKGVIVDVYCRRLSPCWPNPLYSLYYRKLLHAYAAGPVLVWEGKKIVGFLPISVVDCGIPELPHCIHYTGGLAYGAERPINLSMIEEAQALSFEKLNPKEIRIGCMTVHSSYRGRSLGVSMVECLVDWARGHGWERVRARAMLDGEPEAFYPTLSWWKGLGFEAIGEERSFGPSNDLIDRARAVDLALELDG